MLRFWIVPALLLSLSACVVSTPEPPTKDEAGATADTKKDAPDADKTEAKISTPKTPPPKLDVPPKAEVDRDCGGVDPKPVEPDSVTPLTLPDSADPALTDPTKATATAPEKFKVKFTTSAGDFTIEAYRPWSPTGVDRFYNLVKMGYFDGNKFFRAVDGFMIQFGITGYPEVNAAWSQARIKDDPVAFTNKRGTVTFAKCGRPDCRSTQLFINTTDRNTFLDSQGFAPFGVIVDGMENVDKINTCYGDMGRPGDPKNKGPNQGLIQQLGNAYLDAGWPELDGIVKAEIVE